jgi:hypothetical protein
MRIAMSPSNNRDLLISATINQLNAERSQSLAYQSLLLVAIAPLTMVPILGFLLIRSPDKKGGA